MYDKTGKVQLSAEEQLRQSFGRGNLLSCIKLHMHSLNGKQGLPLPQKPLFDLYYICLCQAELPMPARLSARYVNKQVIWTTCLCNLAMLQAISGMLAASLSIPQLHCQSRSVSGSLLWSRAIPQALM